MIYELKLLQTLVSSMKAFNLFISLVYFNLQSGCLNNIMNESKIFYIEQILSDKLMSLARWLGKVTNDKLIQTDSMAGSHCTDGRAAKKILIVFLAGDTTDRQTAQQTARQPASQFLSASSKAVLR